MKHKGALTLMTVMLVMMLGMLILVGWQNRLILSVQRNQSLKDLVSGTYAAESEVYDWMIRFLANYPNMFPSPLSNVDQVLKDNEVLADGTRLNVVGRLNRGAEELEIVSNRQFSSSTFLVSRRQTSMRITNVGNLEIALALDCTTSMNEPADDYCRQRCCSPGTPGSDCGGTGTGNTIYRNCMERTTRPDGSMCTTRIAELKKASTAFVEKIKQYAIDNPDNQTSLGLVLFRRDAAWVREPSTDIQGIETQIASGFGQYHSGSNGSPICREGLYVSGSTSPGSAFDVMNQRFSTDNNPTEKEVEVLVTDGEPNTRVAANALPYTAICSGNNCASASLCTNESLQLLTCSLTKASGMTVGSRPDNVDVYTVVTLDRLRPDIRDIFVNNSTGFYAAADATRLAEQLGGIFQSIVNSVQNVGFEKIIPTPVR